VQICILTLEATLILTNALSIWPSGSHRLPDKPAVDQLLQDQDGILFREMRDRIERYLRLQRRLIRVINTRKVLDFSSTRLGVHAFDVAPFTYLKRRIHKHLHIAPFGRTLKTSTLASGTGSWGG
jgi:hypothetical protein